MKLSIKSMPMRLFLIVFMWFVILGAFVFKNQSVSYELVSSGITDYELENEDGQIVQTWQANYKRLTGIDLNLIEIQNVTGDFTLYLSDEYEDYKNAYIVTSSVSYEGAEIDAIRFDFDREIKLNNGKKYYIVVEYEGLDSSIKVSSSLDSDTTLINDESIGCTLQFNMNCLKYNKIFYIVFMLIIATVPAVFISKILNTRLEFTFAIAIFLQAVVGMIFGFANVLVYLDLFLILLSLFMLAYLSYRFVKEGFEINNDFVITIIYMFMLLAITIYNKGAYVKGYDEMDLWANVVKNVFYEDGFESSIAKAFINLRYPPFMVSFTYIYERLNGIYSESILYVARHILVLSCIMPIFTIVRKNTSSKKKIIFEYIVAIFFLLAIPTFLNTDFLNNLQVDTFYSIMFAYAIMAYTFYIFRNEKKYLFFMVFALICICLTKQRAMILALAFVVTLVLKFLFFEHGYKFRDKKHLKKMAVLLVAFVVLALIGMVCILKFKTSSSLANYISTTISIFIGSADTVTYRSIYSFISRFMYGGDEVALGKLKFSVFQTLLLVPMISYTLYKLLRNEKFKMLTKIMIHVSLGGMLYGFAAMMLYQFTGFTEFEKLNLSSYTRYLLVYPKAEVMAFVFGIVAILMAGGADTAQNELSCILDKKAVRNVSIFALICMLITPMHSYLTNLSPYFYRWAYKEGCEHIEELSRTFSDKDDNIYYLSMGDDGYSRWVFGYAIAPTMSSCDGNLDMNKTSKDEFLEMLEEKCDYVYILNTDDEFAKEYADVFEGGADAIGYGNFYRIEKAGDSIKLVKIAHANVLNTSVGDWLDG